MTEDNEYKKLPIEERCQHKLWKARVDGYEEAAKVFRELDDEKSPEWMKYLGLIKKMVVDSNAVAQEKGLEAALIFVENCGHAGKTVGDVMSGIVQKCIAAPKAKTKEISVQITLMYIEIEKHEAVMEELLKGMDHKNPKIVAACTVAATLALREFGTKVVSVKPLIKKLAPLMSDRDKAVRDEGKALAVEIYRWIGAAMKPQIDKLPQVTLKELDDEFEKLKGEKPEPTRYLRSQMQKQMALAAAAAEAGSDALGGDDDDGDGAGDYEEIDAMDLIDPVDILSKLPKDFYDKLEEKKWQLRKESLEALEKLLVENPKLENGEYGNLVNTLKKVITKDTNVVLVAMGGKCLALLAKGLGGKRFSPYASACIPYLLEKFKEKKANVVAALRDAMDAIYPATSLEAMQEFILEALANKNPSVKSETALFLARAFSVTQPATINKKLVKALVTSLAKTLNESDPTVRDSSAEALGTLLKLMGEKAVSPFLVDIDSLKMAKIKECQDKAEIKVKVAGVKKERPASAPSVKAAAPAPVASATAISKGGSRERDASSGTRPATAGGKKPVARKGALGTKASSGGIGVSSKPAMPSERELTPEEVMTRAEELLPPDILHGLSDSNWKNRLAAVESLYSKVPEFETKTPNMSQILMRTVSSRKPGLKEMNFQVLKYKLDIIRLVAETYPTTTITVDLIVNEVTEKLADAKNGHAAAETLTALTEATKLEYMVVKVMSFALEQKSPKVQSEALNWVNNAIREFGFQIQPKVLVEDVRKAVQSVNPTVRSSAIGLIGTMAMYMGPSLMVLFDSEKPALKAQIQAEFDKCVGERPPKPVRGDKKSSGPVAGADDVNNCDEDDDGAPTEQEQMNLSDIMPRVDISGQITEQLLKELCDKDWKTRNEAMNKVQNIIAEARSIKPTIGDLPQALAMRLVDSNAKIAQMALAICEQMAQAMGSGCRQHVRMLFPGFLNALGDSKTFVRAAALNCINIFGEKGGYKDFFEGEMIGDALKTGSPALKSELWGWLAERLPQMPVKSIPKEELTAMVPHLYAHIQDRNVEVRKNANEAVLGIMIHLGYESMVKALDKQKPAAKKDLLAVLDKARPNLPVKPLPKSKLQAPLNEENKKAIRGGGGGAAQAGAKAKGNASDKQGGSAAAQSKGKKEEEIDLSPLLAVNNAKNQRNLDEQKMKVLKWNFTTPREEFSELLKDQMLNANVNKGLMANMFHDDFRYHLKVIESLSEDLGDNIKGLVCNLDLVLKWLSLRFYDTNPSVLIKGLEYLNQAFQKLVQIEYMLGEIEGNAFLPHLILKLGDPKDAVRGGVRSLLRQILLVYPYTKLFAHIMEGLKSKNARQRTECLDELGYLIEQYGINVCQPNPGSAMKEIAKHISDRDNSVRNAALNAVVQGYFNTGEKVFKLIGQLNEKDFSMLDERIKRAKKTRKVNDSTMMAPGGGAKAPVAGSSATGGGLHQQDSMDIDDPTGNGSCDDELPPPDEQGTFDQPSALNLYAHLQQPQQSGQYQPQLLYRPSGPFGLDPNVIEEIEKGWVRVDQMKHVEVPHVDITPLYEPIRILPTKEGVQYPQDKFEQLINHSPRYNHHTTPPSLMVSPAGGMGLTGVSPYISPRQASVSNNSTFGISGAGSGNTSGSLNVSPNLADVLPKHDPNLVRIIKNISSNDLMIARAALNEISDIAETPEKQAVLRDYEELFIQNILAQLKNLSQLPLNEALVVYQPIFTILYTFFHSKTLGRTLSAACIKNLMSALLHLMADQKFSSSDDAQYNKVINGICLKVLDKTNFTNLNCALIRLLRESCPVAGLPKFTDLLMKCIWRNVKMLPERSNELNYDAVILEIHEFMLALPSSWWQTRPSDTPLRTVKTIIHNMAKVKGNGILQHLNQIPTHSELHSYLIKILKNLQKEGNLPNTGSPQRSALTAREGLTNATLAMGNKRISNQTTDAMSQIFRLISDKETKQQGLHMLYEFKAQNPDVDISAFLKGATPNFQKHIDDALAEIANASGMPLATKATTAPSTAAAALATSSDYNSFMDDIQAKQGLEGNKDRKYGVGGEGFLARGDSNCHLQSNTTSSTGSANYVNDPEMWMERLQALRAKGNIGILQRNPRNDFYYKDNKISDENLNLMATAATTTTAMTAASINKPSLIRTEKPEIAPNRLQHIQAKLAQIKRESQT